MDAVILAGGGAGSAAADGTPRSMAPIEGRPFLEWLLGYLGRQELREVTLALGHGAGAIRARLGDRFGEVSLRYVIESEPLGTGGAVRAALSGVREGPVFVLEGDHFTVLDYWAMRGDHQAAAADVTLALARVDDCAPYESVSVEGQRVVGLHEKGTAGPGWARAGAYLIEPRLLLDGSLPDAFSLDRDFLEPRLASLRPLAHTSNGLFLDLGFAADSERAQRELPRYVVAPS